MGLILDGMNLLDGWPAPRPGMSDPSGAPRVLDWREHGLEFRPGRDAVRRRGSAVINLVVGHWTAGEGGSRALFNTLQSRGFSVQLFIDQSGTVYQFCDLRLRCDHATGVNDRSIGVEIANRGAAPALAAFPRETYSAVLHGRRGSYLRFYDSELLAWLRLCNILACRAAIPARIPVGPTGGILSASDPQIARGFTGFCEHLQVTTTQKPDAGLQLVEVLRRANYGVQPLRCPAVPRVSSEMAIL